MTDISPTEAAALVRILSMAENHPMWSSHMAQSPTFKDFTDETYSAIQTVREFLKRNGIATLHALAERLAAEAEAKGDG